MIRTYKKHCCIQHNCGHTDITMTKEDLMELNALKARATILQELVDDVVQKAEMITGENPEESSWTFDFILNDCGTVDELLEKLQVEVSNS